MTRCKHDIGYRLWCGYCDLRHFYCTPCDERIDYCNGETS